MPKPNILVTYKVKWEIRLHRPEITQAPRFADEDGKRGRKRSGWGPRRGGRRGDSGIEWKRAG